MNMIRVNGVAIGEDAVAREMQHHPAASREDAANEAATALVIRELLLQRVAEREIAGADDDQRIANLIDSEIRIPEPTQEEIPLLSPQHPPVHRAGDLSGRAYLLPREVQQRTGKRGGEGEGRSRPRRSDVRSQRVR